MCRCLSAGCQHIYVHPLKPTVMAAEDEGLIQSHVTGNNGETAHFRLGLRSQYFLGLSTGTISCSGSPGKKSAGFKIVEQVVLMCLQHQHVSYYETYQLTQTPAQHQ